MPTLPLDHPALRAAEHWRDSCLLEGRSVFTDRPLWTSDNLVHLIKHFAENLDEGEGSFFSKLEKQLAPAPSASKQLAAEMFWVMYLFPVPKSMQIGTKIQHISRIWEWSDEPMPKPQFDFEESLRKGVGNPGPKFNIERWQELLYFIRVLESWMKLTETQRQSQFASEWSIAGWLDEHNESGTRQLRHMLLFLLFPYTFEPIASSTQKSNIVKSFQRELGQNLDDFVALSQQDVDRHIQNIRNSLVNEGADTSFSFYDKPYSEVWNPTKEIDGTPPVPSGETRYWLLAPGPGANLWDEFLEKEKIAIGWDELGDLSQYQDIEAVFAGLRDSTYAPSQANAKACYQFVHEMQSGHHVIIKGGATKILGHGVIISDYKLDDSRTLFKNIRKVRWINKGEWPVPGDKQLPQKTLTDVSNNNSWLPKIITQMEGETKPTPTDAAYTRADALSDLFLSADQFDQIMSALERKKNIILEGPPGVGKTFVAKRFAYQLNGMKDSTKVEMVQFHQSYSYEDFIQGYRPKKDGGFELHDSVFYRFCKRAAANPGNCYIFIIDEVNRGNLSKIFGELLMLIEADKRGLDFSIPLTYSAEGETFYVPSNLYLIGTMNTADRSLAMVDYALRRRFAFFRLKPAFERDEFSNFLSRRGMEPNLIRKTVERLSNLNERIKKDRSNLGPGFEIGHSFFCPGEDDNDIDEAWYREIVLREIEPLLREYWFDRPDFVDNEIQALLR